MADKDFGNIDLPEGFSEKELRWSYWWINNRDKVMRAGVGALIALDVALGLFGLWGFTDWLLISGVAEDRAIRTMASNAYGRLGNSTEAIELTFDEPLTFDLPGGGYDLLAMTQNPNARYVAEVTYRFKIGETETPERIAFVLPGQAKYLTELGWRPEGDEAPSGDVSLQVVKRVWSLVDPHEVADPARFMESHLDFKVSEPVFEPAATGSTVPVSRSRFTIVNGTPYGYYDVDLLVLLYRGDTPVAATSYRLNRFGSGQAQPVELFWYQPLPQITRTEVLPDVNVFDSASYRAPR